jgi:vacuolar protein sorting-associated protein 3
MAARSSTFPHSNVLVLASDSIQSLLPSTLISQVEALLESHKIEDAAELADQQKKKFQTRVIVDEDEVMTINPSVWTN